MAKNAKRVNGRHGECMWVEDALVRFKTSGETYELPIDEFEGFGIMNVADARARIEASRDVMGSWTHHQRRSNAKTLILVGYGVDFCCVMEVTKSQGPSALSFARGICPSGTKEEEQEEYKLYAAVQTPRGGMCVIGTIACALLAYYFVGVARLAIPGLICAALSIFLFIKAR